MQENFKNGSREWLDSFETLILSLVTRVLMNKKNVKKNNFLIFGFIKNEKKKKKREILPTIHGVLRT